MSQATADPEPAERTTPRAAHRALADARAVLDRSAATQPTGGRDASLVLRDLALNLDDLPAADRLAAKRDPVPPVRRWVRSPEQRLHRG